MSSSHFSQFCKAIASGCKSPIAELMDANGRTSIEEGWKWLVIPWFVEARVVANLVYMHLRETTMKTFVVCPCTTDFRLLGK